MKISITREVTLDPDEIGLLKHLHEHGQAWSYACDEFAENVFESLNWKGLTSENADGKATLTGDGYNALAQALKAQG